MRRSFKAGVCSVAARRQLALVCCFLFAGAALAQSGRPAASPRAVSSAKSLRPAKATAAATVPVLMVSDIHFEPFWDPAKVQQLVAAPTSAWNAILSSSPSPDQARRFAAVERACATHGPDTTYALYASSLQAMRASAARATFVVVSGDLISHEFDCKFHTVLPHATPAAYHSFVEKTVDYVIGELYRNFPGVPVYVALGNNDSDCGDYQMDARSPFLADTGKEVTSEFPAPVRARALATFAEGGYYSVPLPAPIKNTRLLVLNDIFMAKHYSTCKGRDDSGAANEQIAWLAQQLAAARRDKKKVWIMGHIPPGVDLISTVKKMENVCGGKGPSMYLSSETMADTMVAGSDVIDFAIFAHTHMNEMRLLRKDGSGSSASGTGSVAVKMVPSISPIHGNRPSFTVAQVDPATGELRDYTVVSASNLTGEHAAWNNEYGFQHNYGQSSFTPATVGKIMAGFSADSGAKTEASRNYIHDFSLGYLSPVLEAFWPQYVCTLANHTKESFRACVCAPLKR